MNKDKYLSILLYEDYKQFIKDYIVTNRKVRGLSKKIADASNCQPSYLSQVLNSKVQLTPDQALGMSHFFTFNDEEQEYFFILVNFERASTKELKKYLLDKIKKIQEEQADIGKKLNRKNNDKSDALNKYYSSWLFALVHILTSIPIYQTLDKLTVKIGIPKEDILEVLFYLEKIGLVNKSNGRWVHSGEELHIDKSSPLISLHHNNWRQRAVLDSQKSFGDNLHFSGIYSMTKTDFLLLKNKLLVLLKEFNEIALTSKQEEAIIFCCDLFSS